MKLLKRLMIGLLTCILLLLLTIVGISIYAKVKYDINVIETFKQVKVLTEDVDENELCPNAFSESDMVDVVATVNESVDGLIDYSEESGYSFDFDSLPSEMSSIIKLSDKNVGALANELIKEQLGDKIEVGGKTLGVELKQVSFNIQDDNTQLNLVVALDISSLKDSMNKFILSSFKKYVPDKLYISSTTSLDPEKENSFDYNLTSDSFTINNLSAEDTIDLFHTLDTLLDIGSSDELNITIGLMLMDVLVGNEKQPGLAYSLKDIGATDYDFERIEGINYFIIKR